MQDEVWNVPFECVVCSIKCAVCSVQCAECNVQVEVWSVKCAVKGASSQDNFGQAESQLDPWFTSEPEPTLARKLNFHPSPSRAQLGCPTNFRGRGGMTYILSVLAIWAEVAYLGLLGLSRLKLKHAYCTLSLEKWVKKGQQLDSLVDMDTNGYNWNFHYAPSPRKAQLVNFTYFQGQADLRAQKFLFSLEPEPSQDHILTFHWCEPSQLELFAQASSGHSGAVCNVGSVLCCVQYILHTVPCVVCSVKRAHSVQNALGSQGAECTLFSGLSCAKCQIITPGSEIASDSIPFHYLPPPISQH